MNAISLATVFKSFRLVRPVLIATQGFCRLPLVIAGAWLLCGCALNGDFDRPRPSLVTDDMHAWIGKDLARGEGIKPSTYPLTDDERQLRDLAYPLIEPPYSRNRWNSVLNEYGLTLSLNASLLIQEPLAYADKLMNKAYRSATARYFQLNDDIRNDVVRIDPFFGLARRVIEIDSKREAAMSYTSAVSEGGFANARARIAENALIVGWVQCSLAQRAAGYRTALEKLVIATPAPMAVEAERSITLMQQELAKNQVVAAANLCGGLTRPPAAIVSKG